MRRSIVYAVIGFLIISTIFIVPLSATTLELREEEMSASEKSDFWENIDFEVSNKPLSDEDLVCFNVSFDGIIALGADSGGIRRSVALYDSNLNFINRFYFDSYGDYYLAWENDSLVIFMVRSSIAVRVSTDGDLIDIAKAKNCPENRNIINDEFKIKQKIVDNKTYKLTNGSRLLDAFSVSYSSLAVTDEGGAQTVIYGSEASQNDFVIKFVLIIVGIHIFVLVAVLIILRSVKVYKKEHR